VSKYKIYLSLRSLKDLRRMEIWTPVKKNEYLYRLLSPLLGDVKLLNLHQIKKYIHIQRSSGTTNSAAATRYIAYRAVYKEIVKREYKP